jgi:hypothetical protein
MSHFHFAAPWSDGGSIRMGGSLPYFSFRAFPAWFISFPLVAPFPHFALVLDEPDKPDQPDEPETFRASPAFHAFKMTR